MKPTFIIEKGESFYIGTTKEFPGVLTQGKTIKETKLNLLDAYKLYRKTLKEDFKLKDFDNL